MDHLTPSSLPFVPFYSQMYVNSLLLLASSSFLKDSLCYYIFLFMISLSIIYIPYPVRNNSAGGLLKYIIYIYIYIYIYSGVGVYVWLCV